MDDSGLVDDRRTLSLNGQGINGQSVISPEVLARYAADAALEVEGVRAVVEGVRKGVRVEDGVVEIHLSLAWGASIPDVGAAVQRHVADYLERMAEARPATVNVVVDEIDGTS